MPSIEDRGRGASVAKLDPYCLVDAIGLSVALMAEVPEILSGGRRASCYPKKL